MSSFYFWHWRICVLMRLNKGAFSNCSSLKEVNYKGTEEQWNKIEIGVKNSCLTNAEINYNK